MYRALIYGCMILLGFHLVSNIIDLFNVYFDEGSTNSVLSEKV